MTVVTLQDYTPAPRYDSVPWTGARIEEATASTGPWTAIETFTFSLADSDPSDPQARSFTTEAATLDQGWYRVVWLDGDGNEQPTEPIQNLDRDDLVTGVGRMLWARTVQAGTGRKLGTFTADTEPTYQQVVEMIDQAQQDIDMAIGADTTTLPRDPRIVPMANVVLKLRTAMLVERSYFPEQVASGRSPYTQLADDYKTQLAALARAAEQAGAGDQPGSADDELLPVYSFPAADRYHDRLEQSYWTGPYWNGW